MKRILIANRGEIACRIIKCCKLLGHTSITLHSEADKNSLHTRMSDESYYLGLSKAEESYLNVKAILKIAEDANVDAIHPGFGFLSENKSFAEAVIQKGITWIGPSPKNIENMGSKNLSRELATAAGLPICPGINDLSTVSEDELKSQCEEIGYPILIKASAGGGGIGMSIAKNYEELKNSISKTKNLALKAFGDDHIFLEKFIQKARHIEVQVFGYGKDGAIHLYERDCSMQRRFQKVIEESPAPNVHPKILREMAECAKNLTATQKYDGAGTVEFIYDVEGKKFYFLEMNTRIQVEHPVTEMVTNIDLIAMQIQYAFNRNKKIIDQENITVYGNSIECRVYAEDPDNNFIPSPGVIKKLHFPKIPSGIRLDWGFEEGDEISFYYDPMIGKIISHEHNRENAINNLINFLELIEIKGIKTNISFLLSLLKSNSFKRGTHNTKFIENNMNSVNAISAKLHKTKEQLTKNTVKVDPGKIKIVQTSEASKYNSLKRNKEMKVVFFD